MRWVEFGGDGGVGWMVSSWFEVDSRAAMRLVAAAK